VLPSSICLRPESPRSDHDGNGVLCLRDPIQHRPAGVTVPGDRDGAGGAMREPHADAAGEDLARLPWWAEPTTTRSASVSSASR
jgi:hypothetical protein